MSTSADLLGQIVKGNYDASSQALLHMARSYPCTVMHDSLQMIEDELRERILMLRDHVTHYLGLTPLYFALQLTSPDMMAIAHGTTSFLEARNRVLMELLRRIADTPGVLDSSRVDTVKLATSECSVLLPHVLRSRADQMRELRVYVNKPEGTSAGPHQISIDGLWQTAYGRMILRALEIPSRTRIVESKEWSEIRRTLSEAGFEPDRIVHDLPYAEWLGELKSVRAGTSRQTPESAELQSLDNLFWALEEIGYSNDNVAVAAMQIASKCGSRVVDTAVRARAAAGTAKVRERALETLVECSGPDVVDFLGSMLDNKEDPIRDKVAEALSSITSRDFCNYADLTVRTAALTVREIPVVSPDIVASKAFLDSIRTLLKHRSSLVRSEGSKILLSLGSRARSHVMDELSTDGSATVRVEILSLVASLPEDDARTIILRGMKDESLRIRKLAAAKAEQLELH